MYTLLDHLKSLNAEARKWAEENNGWASEWTLDLKHWAEMGVYTAADFIRHNLINSISDASKDLYGCRLRLDWDEMSVEDMERMYDNICRQLNEQYEMEKEAEALAAEWKKGLPDDCEPLPYEEYAYLEETA
jgi:hypothetical protein